MRFVYCDACGRVSTNVWTEHNLCTACGHSAEPVRMGRPWQSWVGNAVVVLAVGLMVLVPRMDDTLRVALLLGVLALAYGLSAWSLKVAKRRVLDVVRARNLVEGGKA